MSTINTILNKLGKIEAIEKTNLEKHEVELANINELDKLINNNNSLYSEFVNVDKLIKPSLLKAQEEAKKAFTLLNKYIENIENSKETISKIEAQIKELGLDPKTALKEKYATIEKVKALNLNSFNTWKNNYNSFVKIQAPNID
jgi:hypothetical protein